MVVSIWELYEEENKLRRRLRDEWWLDREMRRQIEEKIREIEDERWKRVLRGEW